MKASRRERDYLLFTLAVQQSEKTRARRRAEEEAAAARGAADEHDLGKIVARRYLQKYDFINLKAS